MPMFEREFETIQMEAMLFYIGCDLYTGLDVELGADEAILMRKSADAVLNFCADCYFGYDHVLLRRYLAVVGALVWIGADVPSDLLLNLRARISIVEDFISAQPTDVVH